MDPEKPYRGRGELGRENREKAQGLLLINIPYFARDGHFQNSMLRVASHGYSQACTGPPRAVVTLETP